MTVLTQDPDKITNVISPKLKVMFAVAHAVVSLCQGKEGMITAGRGASLGTLASHDNEMTKVTRHIAARYPDMKISAAALTLLSGMTVNDRQLEIVAASVATRTLADGRPLGVERLISEILVIGYPKPEFMRELEKYYDDNPDLLWPPLRETVN